MKVCQVNADDNPDLSIWYEVQSVPTLLYFIHGRLCAKVVGTLTRDAILARLKLVLQHNQATLSGANPGAAK
ncbi:MAG: thioredoxin family protein [Verrucomicrobiota bacterium]